MFYTPGYFPLIFFISSTLLIISACMLWTRMNKAVWFSCVSLACINIGIACWSAVYSLGSHCDGYHEIRPDSFLGKMSIVVAAILVLSLPVFLSDIKRIIQTPAIAKVKNKTASRLLAIMVGMIFLALILAILMIESVNDVYASCKWGTYASTRDDIQNSVVAYMADHSSQLPILSENATFITNYVNGSYYIINMSQLLTANGGLLTEVPDICIQIPGPDNDNCDGGATGCSNTSRYVWGVDNRGIIASKLVNASNMGPCECNTCDGYLEGRWP